MRITAKHFVVASLLTGSVCATAADWGQYRGPNHDGASPEKINKQWPADGPKALWKVPLKDGFSSMTTGDGKVYTIVARNIEGVLQEVCVALDAKDGKELWASQLGIAKYDGGGSSGAPGNNGGDGPRSTPSFDGGKIYTYSSKMLLKCVNAADGKDVWSVDVVKEYGGVNITWGSAASPLIDGDMVFVEGGGGGQGLLAFNKKDGKLVWKGENDKLTQSTPIAATILGTRQVIFFTQSGLVSVAPASGKVLWRYAFPYKTSTGISPVVAGDVVYCAAGYGVGAGAVKIAKEGDGFTATQLWMNPGSPAGNHWSTPVSSGGYIYGIYDHGKFATAPLQCVDAKTGEVKWKKAGFGPGGVNLVDGHLMVLSDAGELVLVKASPDEYTEVARSKVLAGKCWNSIAISGGKIFARSTKEGVCLDLAPKEMAKE